VSPQQPDDFDDDEREEFASRSIFAAGWFRAVLVLTVLAIVVVVSLPYLLNWFEPAPPPARPAKPVEMRSQAPSAPPAPAVAPAPPPPVVATAPSPPKAAAPAPPPAAPKTAADKAAPAAPAPKAIADKPAAPRAAKPMEAPAAPARVAKAAAPESKAAPVPKVDGARGGEGGGYWVQLGVFKDARNAEGLAQALRKEGFPVEVARVNRAEGGAKAAATLHEIFVTEAGVDKVSAALGSRGAAESVAGGVVVKPALSLQEAMAVSKQLTTAGLKVVIRPAGGGAGAQGTTTFHLVRAGGYADRARALAAREQLKGKGHEGFLTQGPAK
jgi:cell division septation protein DedD